MAKDQIVNIFWFRRDLRLEDNTGLHHALQSGLPIIPIFIFDRAILDQLDNKADRRVEFIMSAIEEMQMQLIAVGSGIKVYYDTAIHSWENIINEFSIHTVYTNHDYEPYAIERDQEVEAILMRKGIGFKTYKDQVIFEKKEIVKDDGKPYTVFTPYSRKWKAALTATHTKGFPTQPYYGNFLKTEAWPIPTLSQIGFVEQGKTFPSSELQEAIVKKYTEQRNFPAIEGTSKMGIHLRFGTVSIRQLLRKALTLNETFVNELIWRDFYHMILWNFPQVGKGKAFKAEYDLIDWRNNEKEFEAWCNGVTGYPIVDAGMRELNETGYMHNRVRMIVASFLTKHLLIDWRWGEAYFAQKLLDFDLAANNGGWQWAAGSGCDAAPYFRIFNPYLQTQKFDPSLEYIRKWIPELEEFHYPKPIVDHDFARKRCLEVFGKALKREV